MTGVERTIKDSLQSAGLLPFLNQSLTQVLDFPDGIFLELVLTDASKLEDAEKAVAKIREQLAKKKTNLDSVIRALWKVKSVHRVGPALGSPGRFIGALAFHCILESGRKECIVEVDVTYSALDALQKKLGRESAPDWSNANDAASEALSDVVKQFLILQLSLGGTSYWDPIRFPKQELNEAALLYLLTHSTAYRALESAIDDTLDPRPGNLLLQEFLQSLSEAQVSPRNFELAISLVPPESFGGAYQPGKELETSAQDAYSKLGVAEREFIKERFFRRLRRLQETLPMLKARHPALFAE